VGARRDGDNTGTVLTLALNYSARSELVDAFRSMVTAAAQNGGIDHLHIDEDMVSRHLYTSALCLIRIWWSAPPGRCG
jgi:undecaprenyl diphosphate synthase